MCKFVPVLKTYVQFLKHQKILLKPLSFKMHLLHQMFFSFLFPFFSLKMSSIVSILESFPASLVRLSLYFHWQLTLLFLIIVLLFPSFFVMLLLCSLLTFINFKSFLIFFSILSLYSPSMLPI